MTFPVSRVVTFRYVILMYRPDIRPQVTGVYVDIKADCQRTTLTLCFRGEPTCVARYCDDSYTSLMSGMLRSVYMGWGKKVF